MAGEQAGTNPPETQSYDGDLMADVRSAFTETATKAEAVTEKPVDPVVEAALDAKVEAAPDKPVESRADHPTDPARYADGTFKPKAGEPANDAAVLKQEPVTANDPAALTQAAQTATQAAPAIAPPGGFSPKSKADWEKITAAYPHLAADIAKREKEVADGFAQYEGMRELRPYVDLARSQGQTLKQALDRYTGIETSLRQKPLETLLYLAGNAGYPPQRLAMELAPYLGPSNGQVGAPQDQSAAQQPIDPAIFQQWLNPLAQEVNQLKSLYQQQSEAQRAREMSTIGTVLERFKSDPAHRYYENVEPQMTQLFERGVVTRSGDYAADLKTAYDMACRMDPEISELLLNERIAKTEAARQQQEKETAEKARLASRSITGSPSSAPSRDANEGGDSIEDDVRRAYRAHAA